MRNIRLKLSYDGTNYVGWQVQPNGPSVQEAVETAIRKLTGERVRVLSAGRTDAGVHALGQVANFHTGSSIPVEKFRPALENFLPEDIAVLQADEVSPDFHATYRAVKKRYRYVVWNRKGRHPFLRNYVLRYAQPLDVPAMQEAARHLIGRHDFRCFESEYGRRVSSVRTVFEAVLGRHADWPVWQQAELLSSPPPSGEDGGDFIWFDIVADGFLYNMVRAIVGTLLHVGRGRWQPDRMREIIAGQNRSQAGETAPAHGLYLVSVEYEDEQNRDTPAGNSPRPPVE